MKHADYAAVLRACAPVMNPFERHVAMPLKVALSWALARIGFD